MTPLSRQNQRSIARSRRTVHYNHDNGRHRGDWRFKHMICFHGFPGWVLPRISPQKEDKHARRLEKQSQLCQRTKRNQEGTSKSNTRSDMKKARLGTTWKLKMLRPKSVKETRPRHKHKVQLGSFLPGESSLLIFVKWKKTRDAPVDSQGCEKTADESQSPEVRGDEIGDPVGWGKGKADTVVSSEPTMLIYEK